MILSLAGCQEQKSDPPNSKIHREKLKMELDNVFEMDQKCRGKLNDTIEKYGWNSPQVKNLWKEQKKLDSLNLIKVLKIIKEIKVYPGDSIVGYPTRKAAFFVLQHAPDSIQDKYLPLIVDASKNGQLDKKLAAMYHDRYLLHRDLPQIYGSQFLIKTITDSTTGEEKRIHELYKLRDTSKVDSLRRSVGMIPLEEYKRLNGIQ